MLPLEPFRLNTTWSRKVMCKLSFRVLAMFPPMKTCDSWSMIAMLDDGEKMAR
jgi:hypothetical protein